LRNHFYRTSTKLLAKETISNLFKKQNQDINVVFLKNNPKKKIALLKTWPYSDTFFSP